MIHQIERKGQDLGSRFFIYIDKSQSSLKDRIEERIEKRRLGIPYNITLGEDQV